MLRGDCSIRIDGIGFTDVEIAECAAKLGLLSIEIELAGSEECRNVCCRGGAKPQVAMSVDEIRGLIQQAVELGARRCILVDSGTAASAALDPTIISCRQLWPDMQLELIVESTAIDAQRAVFLREQNVNMSVNFESVSGNAMRFLKDAGYGTGGPSVAVRVHVTPENLADVPAIWRSIRGQGMEPRVQIITPRDSVDGSPSVVDPNRAKSMFEELAAIDRAEFNRVWPAPPSLIGRSCKRHQFACHVTSCGTIFPCVGVTIPIGNIRNEPLSTILTDSEVMENLRVFREKVKEPCRTCCKTTDCYGCRGAAYQLTGDYLAGDSMCWKAVGTEIVSLPVAVSDLVPHGPSIRMVDRLLEVGERRARAEYVVRGDSMLVDESGGLDDAAYIEMIAQAFAASHGFHLSADERPLHRGLLLGVKDLAVSRQARAGDRLSIEVRKVARFGDFGIIEGTIRNQRDELVAVGTVKVWRPGEDGKAMFE